jgi:hypothetical protein
MLPGVAGGAELGHFDLEGRLCGDDVLLHEVRHAALQFDHFR